ncbi:MAG: hypothetical protein Q8K63_15675 [Acidimicrobiales bacterium]|nr:hypothetical protein [Acidimicrobiales bacterium]
MKDLDKSLAAIAIKQHSVITLDDVIAAGGSESSASRRCRSGHWELVYDGVYRIAGVPWTWKARVMAVVLAAGPGAVVSHLCACRLHGFGFTKAPIEITVPRGRRCFIKGVIVHTSTDLVLNADTKVDGIPVTDPDRTMLDIAKLLKPVAFGKAVEQARRSEDVDWHSLIKCLTTHARRGRPGIRKLRTLIVVNMHNDEVTDTDSELIALSLLRESGFAEPVLQHRIYDADGILQAEMDFAWLDRLVNIEINGEVHRQEEVIAKDDERDHYVRGLGWTVRRVWWKIPVYEPAKFIRIVRETLRSAQPVISEPGVRAEKSQAGRGGAGSGDA